GLLDSAREDYAQARKPGHWRKAKKRGRQRAFHKTTPPPPAKTIGGGGRISREIYRFFGFRAITWRRGVKSPRNTVLGCFAHHSAEGAALLDCYPIAGIFDRYLAMVPRPRGVPYPPS